MGVLFSFQIADGNKKEAIHTTFVCVPVWLNFTLKQLLPFNNKHNLAHLRHIEAFQRKIRLQKKI
jgi:hypothetical protein